MKRRGVWLACLILAWLMSCPMRPLYATQEPESEMMPRSECEKELTKQWLSHDEELMELGEEHEAAMRKQGAECEARVKAAAAEGAEAGAAEVARDLLPKIAGLKAERDYWRSRAAVFAVGGILTGVVAGIILGVLL